MLNKSNNYASFHESIKFILVFSQFFGVLTVKNVTDSNERNLKFSWTSWKTIYSMIFLVCCSAEGLMATRRLFRLGFNLRSAEGFFFFGTSVLRAFLLFRITRHWKEIMEYWKKCEKVFLKPPYFEKNKLEKKCKVIFLYLVVEFIIPHCFYLAAGIHDNYTQLENCPHQLEGFWQNYLAHYRPHLLYHIPYSPFLLPVYEWVNLLQAYVLNFSDAFLILLATGISARFNQFNDLLEKMIQQENYLANDKIWRRLRLHYVKLMNLVRYVDSHIHILSFVCIGHNSLLLTVRVFNAFKPNRISTINHIYFWFYLIILITRLLGVLFTCANMNICALKPLELLKSVPAKHWTLDLKILYDVIQIDDRLAFSIAKSSFITRSMILSLFATMATFQIILLDQLNEKKDSICTFVDI